MFKKLKAVGEDWCLILGGWGVFSAVPIGILVVCGVNFARFDH